MNEISITGFATKMGEIVAYIRKSNIEAAEEVNNVRHCSSEPGAASDDFAQKKAKSGSRKNVKNCLRLQWNSIKTDGNDRNREPQADDLRKSS